MIAVTRSTGFLIAIIVIYERRQAFMQRRITIPRILIKAGLLLLLSALLLTTATYAWLREGFVTPDSEVSFTTGKLNPPPAKMWIYTDEDEDENLAAASRWVEQNVTTVGSENTAPAAASSVTDGKYTFTLTSLHLGTIDNLIFLGDDNDVYFRVMIDPATLGNTVAITVALKSADGLELYDAEGTPVTDETEGEHPKTPLADLYEINAEKPLLKADYVVSKTAYTPYTMTDGVKNGFSAIGADTTYVAPDSDSYYLYLRIRPNLTAFMEATRFLYVYMPCTMLFSMDIDLMIYQSAV